MCLTMDEAVTLVKLGWDGNDRTVTRREVLCRLLSIGQAEFYQANAQDIHPEGKFVLADYLDYEGESLLVYSGRCFRVLRTYRAGQVLELTVEAASAEESKLAIPAKEATP